MKSICLFVSGLLLSLLSVAIGQDETTSKFSIGVEVGFSSTKFIKITNDEPLFNKHSKFCYVAGVNIQYQLNRFFAVHTSVNYENKGSEERMNRSNSFVQSGLFCPAYEESKEVLNYINLPISLVFYTPGELSFFAGIGPNFSFFVNGRKSYPTGSGYTYSDYASDQYKRFDFGLVTTLGVKLPLGLKLGAELSLRNTYGLQAVNQMDSETIYKINSLAGILSLKYRL